MFQQAILRITGLFLVMASLALPAFAKKTTTQTVHVRAYVMPTCRVQVQNYSVKDNHLVLTTDRRCNMTPDLKISKTSAKFSPASEGDVVTIKKSKIHYPISKVRGESFFLVVAAK